MHPILECAQYPRERARILLRISNGALCQLCQLIAGATGHTVRAVQRLYFVQAAATTTATTTNTATIATRAPQQVEKKTAEELQDGVTRETSLNSKLNLVDLAGSERSKKTGATGTTLKEGSSINK